MGAGAGSWEKAQQEGGDPLHRSDGGVGAGIRSWRRGARGERWRQRRRNRRAGHIVVGGKRAAAAQERADEPRTQA